MIVGRTSLSVIFIFIGSMHDNTDYLMFGFESNPCFFLAFVLRRLERQRSPGVQQMCSTQPSLSTVRASTPKLESICSLCVRYKGVRLFLHAYHIIAESSLSARCIHLCPRAVQDCTLILQSIDALQVSWQIFYSLIPYFVRPVGLTDDGLLARLLSLAPRFVARIRFSVFLVNFPCQFWANRQTPNSLGEAVVHPASLPGALHVHGHSLLFRILSFISLLLSTLESCARFRTTHSSSSFCLLACERRIVHVTVLLKQASVVFSVSTM